MIVEHALLRVREGMSEAFEAALRTAVPLIAASPGFCHIEVRPAAEAADYYLLRVTWDNIASHREGFRKSDRYAQWCRLLHHFYDPMPSIQYFGPSIIDRLDTVQ